MNIYVSPTGSDTTGDGSSSNPYQHIYKAIDEANDGDTIICKPGTYNESEGRIITDKNLTIQSEEGNYSSVTIIIDGIAEGYWEKAWLILKMTDKTLTIKNLTIKWGSADYQYVKGFILGDQNSPNIEAIGCFFDGTNMPETNSNLALGGRRGNSLKAYKCTFRHFRYNDANGRGIRTWDVDRNIVVRDNIFEDCECAIYNESGTVDSDYNCYYNNDTNILDGSLGSNDITSDPQFIGTDTAELQDSSPCIDAGITVSGYVEDYEGTAPDIGCYEFSDAIVITTKKATINNYNSVTLKGNISNLSSGDSAYVWFKYRVIGSDAWNETSKELVDSDGDFTKTITTTANDYEFKALGQKTESGSSIEEGEILNFYIMDNSEDISIIEDKNLKYIKSFNEELSLNDSSLAKYVEKVIISEFLSLVEDKKLRFNLYNTENLNIADSKKFKYITFFSENLSLNSRDKKIEKDAYNPWIISKPINEEFPMDIDTNGDGIVDNWEGEGVEEVSLIKDPPRLSVQEVEFLQGGRFYRSFSYYGKVIILFEIKPLFNVNFRIKKNNNILYNYKFYSDDVWRLFLIPFTFDGDYILEFSKEDYSYFYLDNFAIIDYNDYLKVLEKKRPAPTEFAYNFEGSDIVNAFSENFSENASIKSDFSIKWDYSTFNYEKYLNNLINKKILIKTYLDEVFSFLVLGINKTYHPNKQGRNQTYSLTLLVKEV